MVVQKFYFSGKKTYIVVGLRKTSHKGEIYDNDCNMESAPYIFDKSPNIFQLSHFQIGAGWGMDDDPLMVLAKEAFSKYDINESGTIDQKVWTSW